MNIEAELLSSVGVDLGWRLIERFATLNRESGSADEFAAHGHLGAPLSRSRQP